jgi:hypothetical protein
LALGMQIQQRHMEMDQSSSKKLLRTFEWQYLVLNVLGYMITYLMQFTSVGQFASWSEEFVDLSLYRLQGIVTELLL